MFDFVCVGGHLLGGSAAPTSSDWQRWTLIRHWPLLWGCDLCDLGFSDKGVNNQKNENHLWINNAFSQNRDRGVCVCQTRCGLVYCSVWVALLMRYHARRWRLDRNELTIYHIVSYPITSHHIKMTDNMTHISTHYLYLMDWSRILGHKRERDRTWMGGSTENEMWITDLCMYITPKWTYKCTSTSHSTQICTHTQA